MKYVLLAMSYLVSAGPAPTPDWSWLEKERVLDLGNEFFRPVQLEFDKEGFAFIADPKAGKIVKLSPDGRLLFWFGRKGQGPGELQYVSNIAVDSEKRVLWAVDYAANKLVCFDLEGTWLFDRGFGFRLGSIVCRPDSKLIASTRGKASLVLLDEKAQIIQWFGHTYAQVTTDEDRVHVNKRIYLDASGRLFLAMLRAPLVAGYDAHLKPLWTVMRPWTNDRVVPRPISVINNRIHSTEYHLGLFERKGILYVATSYDEQVILAFDAATGQFLGNRNLGYRARCIKVHLGHIYALESEDFRLHTYPLGEGPVLEHIEKDPAYGERYRIGAKTRLNAIVETVQ